MRICVIANPASRQGRSRRTLEALESCLRRHRLTADIRRCESLEHAGRLSAEANRSGYDTVVAAGGDGTINRVLNGFFNHDGRRISTARLGVIYTGTSPDFCRSYGIPTDLHAAVGVLGAGLARRISLGRVVYQDGSGLPETAGRRSAVFGCCVNVGLGAPLARRVNQGVRRRLGDCLGTFVCLMQTLRRYRPVPLEMELDGFRVRLDRVLNLSLGKTLHVASGLKIRHALKANDQRVYVLSLQARGWAELSRAFGVLYRGEPIRDRFGLTLRYAHRVVIRGTTGQPEVEFDGDPAGTSPCVVETPADSVDLLTAPGV